MIAGTARAAAAPARADVLTRAEELERLVPAWRELYARSATATPFQSPAWLVPWWRAFGAGELRIVALHAGGRLAALAPLYLDAAPRPCLRLLGSGNTDHLGALADPGTEDALVAAVEALIEREDVAEADFLQLPAESPLLRVRPAGMRAHVGAGEPCTALPLPGTDRTLERAVPPSFARRIGEYARRLRRNGVTEDEGADGRDPDRAHRTLDEMVHLHGELWRSRGEPGVLADECVVRFHHEVVDATVRAGLLDLHALRLDGRAIAVQYGFRDARRAYPYLGGFDPALASWSPGTVMLATVIEAALGRGAAEIDFLRGREPYKYRWGVRDRPTARLRLAR